MKVSRTWPAAVGAMVLASAAQAALINRGGGMVYDSTLNLTWLADMNHSATSGYAAANAGGVGTNIVNADGRMGWHAANAWATGLVHGGFSDWRLPTVNPLDSTCFNIFGTPGFGTGCTGGELSHLFVFDLGNKADESVLNPAGDSATQIANLALFSNVRSYAYWSGTAFTSSTPASYLFSTEQGSQGATPNGFSAFFAVAVRPGDVAAIPEPSPVALVVAGLMGVVALGNRRRRQR